jgi:PAS domain S-box-containing protein
MVMVDRLKALFFGSLRRQLVVGMALSMAMMMAAFVWGLTQRQKAVQLDQETNLATSLAQSIATSSAVWLASRDFNGLQEIIDAQSLYTDLEFAMVLDNHGQVLAHTNIRLRGKYMHDLPKTASMHILQRTPALVDVACPVVLGGQHKGWVRVGVSQRRTADMIAEIRNYGVLYPLAAIIVCTGLAILMAGQLTRRLRVIQSVADSVHEGKSDLRAQVTGRDEAAQLAQRFNQMLDALAQREWELYKYRQNLETLVENRTSELEKAKDVAEVASRELLQTTEFLNNLITYANAPILVWNPQLRITRFNLACERLTGLEAAAVIGQSPDILFSQGQTSRIMVDIRRTSAAGERQETVEIPVQHVDGSQRTVSWNITGILDPNGIDVAAIIAQGQDITERKRMETELNNQLKFIKTLADAIPSPVFCKDINGLYLWSNKAYENLTGDVSLVGKTVLDVLSPEDAAFQIEMDREMYAENKAISYEYETSGKFGDGRTVILHKAPFMDSQGGVKGLICVMTDITDRKRAEENLKQSDEVFRKILQGIKAGIIIVDPSTLTIVEVNSIAEEILGSPKEDFVGKSCESLKWIREQDGEIDDSCFLQHIDMVNEEYRIERPDGTSVPVMKTVISALQGGKMLCFEIVFDLTARKVLERQLALAQRLESIGGLAAGIAHEINTPIQYIGDNLSFIKDAFTGLAGVLNTSRENAAFADAGIELDFVLEEIPKALAQSQEGVTQVSEIVRAMKRFSRMGSGEKALQDVPNAIDNAIKVSRNEWKYHSEFQLDLDPSAQFLPCYPGDFNQVLLNMLVNASHAINDKYADLEEKGLITIKTRREGDWLELSISDTGCGIPEKNLHRIFDPFFTTKEVGKGTGQGLAICHDIVVKKHGGTINVTSEVGQGTTFVLRFPLQREE